MILKRSLVLALSFFMALFLAACGSYTTPGGGPYGSGSTIHLQPLSLRLPAAPPP